MREPTVWHASDLHLGHKLMTVPTEDSLLSTDHDVRREARHRIPQRPIGYEEIFFKAASDIIRSDDILCLHGDIAFSNIAYWFTRLSALPGKKVLILGNHDHNRIKWYEKWGFREVVPFGGSKIFRHELGNILLTHIPAFQDVLTSYDDRYIGHANNHNKEFDGSSCILNIHGHTHGMAKERHNTFDASLECINYIPMTTDMIVERRFK